MKILIIKFNNIGDVLLSSSLIENLKLYYPDSQIDYALNDYSSSMINNNPNINQIFLYKRSTYKKMSIFKRFIAEFKYFKNIVDNKYDIVINLTKGDRGAILAFFSNAKVRLGYELNSSFKYFKPFTKTLKQKVQHTVQRDLEFINLLDKKIINKKVSIYWNNEDEKKVDKFLQENSIDNFVQVHPVSRWMFKCWDDEKMAKAIDYIIFDKKIDVILTASNDPIEKNKISEIISLCKSKPYNLTGELTLNELAYLSKKANLYFGIDSAPMHMAAAIDTSVVALLGASRADLWGPWDNENNFEYKFIDGIQKSRNHSIISRVDDKIFLENGIKKSKSMIDISFEEVCELLNEKI